MQAENEPKTGPRKKTKTRILKLVPAVVIVLVLLAVFLVPAFVSSGKGRKIILAKINDSIDGQADFSTLSMSWTKGIKVTNVSFNDSAGQISVLVKRIAAKPHYGSILMGSLSFGKTIIDQPKVEINLQARQATKASQERILPDEKRQAVGLPVKKIDLVVNDGSLKVTDRQAATVELSQVNSRLNLRPPGHKTDFDIDMAVVDKDKKAKIRANGQIKPQRKTGWSMKGTSGDLTIEVNDLDIGSLGPIFALAGLEVQAKGIVSANVESKIKDGRFESLNGTIEAGHLDITGPVLNGDRFKTGRLDVAAKLKRQQGLINIEQLDVKADWLTAQATGDVPTTYKSLAEFIKADSKRNLKGSFECDVAQLASQMPRTLGLKEQIEITAGRLTGNIEKLTEAGQGKIYGQANLAGLQGVVDGKTIALSEPVAAQIKLTSDKAGIKYDTLDVSSSFAKINCTGTAEALNYNADIDLSKLQSELGQFVDTGQYTIAGELLSKGIVSSNKDKIIAVGSSEIKNLRLSSAEAVTAFEPKADINFALSLLPDENILNIDKIQANATLGRFDIKDAVLPLGKKAQKPMKLTVSANDIDLQKLQPFAVMFASFPRQMQLAGIAESDVSLISENGTYHIATDSTKIQNLKVVYPQRQPFEQQEVSLVADGQVNPRDKTYAVKWQLSSPKIKIKGQLEKELEGGKNKLQGKADLEYDWAAVSTIASPFLPQGLSLAGQRKDSISFASEYPAGQTQQLLTNLNTKGKLGFEKAEYMGLDFGPTEVDVQIRKGLLEIAPFSTTVNNGQLNFAAQADFKKKPTVLKTPEPIQIAKDIQINDTTTKKLLMYVNPVFANAVNVSGVANFNCEKLAIPLSGAYKNDIEVIGTISINKLQLQASDLLGQIFSLVGAGTRQQEITIHPTRFVLQDGFLRYDDMQLDIGDNPVNFKGVIGLDKSLNMSVTLPYTISGRTVRLGRETVGKRITLPLKGTVDKPELDMGKLLEEQLKQQLEQTLREGLEELFK